jgi:prepilin-type N-terminal cleavage/methylation domain-containing protein
MSSHRSNSGFTLFEVIIAVALVAIMAIAIAPPLIKNLNEGKVARAQSDAQVIGNAVQAFYKDVGDWPLQYDADAAYDTARLVGNASLGGGNVGLPRGADATSDAWRTRGAAAVLDNLLIFNRGGAGNTPLYPVSANPHARPGWNGPYLDRVPLDPWGKSLRGEHPLRAYRPGDRFGSQRHGALGRAEPALRDAVRRRGDQRAAWWRRHHLRHSRRQVAARTTGCTGRH